MSDFKLDDRLEADCFHLGDLPLCRVLLMNDSQYPWFILVPKVAGVTEAFHLDEEQQLQLACESSIFAGTLSDLFEADKMNVAALGNVVSQLHIHHIVRYENDVAWPNPVWGQKPAKPYDKTEVKEIRKKLQSLFDCFE
ncbi:HIT family protein [Endozoicomonas sp. OPT23]|uniref:HIT domain-containing protein n=1 Tax=Endozoicomonas sp. OPT23 TaxID=2072845 RepID=UPI00129BC656|nr:HIT domain-containing protein [Endozoicomonas sp. OPT23]MRI35337.1 HIT family protein [Endozoicomonas sp. OPT23]